MNQNLLSGKPAITVLMAVYNGERWLDESISSVLNQSFRNFEFIVVNDGSTDSSSHILEKYRSKDNRVRVINKNNTGLASSLNKGLIEAKGEWIARLDADDICEKNRLQLQYEFACFHSDAVLIGSGFYQIDENSDVIYTRLYPTQHQALLNRLRKNKAFFPHSSAFFNTKTVLSLSGYRPRITRSEDYDLWLRLSEVGRLYSINKPLVRVRIHQEQISLDGNGAVQFIDGRVALVSYLMRREGLADPVDNHNDESFYKLRKFIENETVKSGDLELHKFIHKLRGSANLRNKSLYDRLVILWLIVSKPFLSLKHIAKKLFGDRFAQAVARRFANSDLNLR